MNTTPTRLLDLLSRAFRRLGGLQAAVLVLGVPCLSAQDKAESPQPTVASSSGFEVTATKALEAMRRRAVELKIQGVAVVAYAEGNSVTSWSSKMLVVGHMTTPASEKDKGNNLLGIAYAKASEMASTLKDSGSGVRPPYTGEFGWQGGVVAQGKTGILIAAFSGGRSEDDVNVSKSGLGILAASL
jgi:hypothetical protein